MNRSDTLHAGAAICGAVALNLFLADIVARASVVRVGPPPLPPICDCYIDVSVQDFSKLFPDIRDWNSLAITLTRGECFGTCAAYSVTIRGDGSVLFAGGRYVKSPGVHRTHIPKAEVRTLFEKFRAANFFALNDNYEAEITDHPTYTVTLRYDAHVKIVTDYVGRIAGMPLVVTELENAIDEAADTAHWVEAGAGQ